MLKPSDLEAYGIQGATEVIYNPSYETLFEEETKSTLEGYEKGQVTELGAVNVMTGVFVRPKTNISSSIRIRRIPCGGILPNILTTTTP